MFYKAKKHERKSYKGKMVMSRIAAAVLSVSILSGFVPGDLVMTSVTAFAEDTVNDEQGLTYTLLEDGTYSVSGCDESAVSVVIPEEYNGVPVTNIAMYAFSSCTSLTSVSIPDSITEIAWEAFMGCSSLSNITIPSSVTSIGHGAFAGCSSLTRINIPYGVSTILPCAFEYCTSLTSVSIPSSVTEIGYSAFEGCESLTSISIPNSVTDIGHSVFRKCSSLYTIDVSEDNMSYCSVDGVLYNKDITEIIAYPYAKGKSYDIPNEVAIIGEYAFADCNQLTDISIPNSVKQINSGAFWGCSSLTDIIITDNVIDIGDSAFYGCTSITEATIPNGVKIIADYTFSNCTSLNNVTIPLGVTSIGNWAFSGCTSLTNVNIPDSVTVIGNWAFEDCSSLLNVTISNGVTSIANSTFLNCESLTKVIIPDGVKEIETAAFCNCSLLQQITIPNSVTYIGDAAFEYCESLSSVKLPNGITSIESSTFEGCSSLTSITIPNNVTSIGNAAFAICTSLKSIYIPSSVSDIGLYAFGYAPNNLLTIYAPSGSFAETFANDNNFNYVEKQIGGSLGLISENGTLTTGICFDENGYINIPALSVDFLYCNIADSESCYTPSDITWTSSDSSIVSIEKVVGNEDWIIDIPELHTQSSCYIAALNEGYATVTASLPNGESLDFSIYVTEQENNCDFDWSYVPIFETTVNDEWFNKSHLKITFFNNAADKYESSDVLRVNNDMLEVYNDMLKDLLILEKATLHLGNLNISLPKNFSFSSEKSASETDGEMKILDGEISLEPGEKYELEIPIYYHGEALINNQKSASSQCAVSFLVNGEKYEYTNWIYIKNMDYVPEAVTTGELDPEPDEPETGKPYVPKPGVTVDAENPLAAFENCYKSFFKEKGNTISGLRFSFRDLSDYITDECFNKIIADTEMFCTFEMMSLPSGGDYSLEKIFGYDDFKASSFLNIGKKALLEFPNVSVNKNFYKTRKTVTVFVELDNTGASIGGATASWCTATWYIKLSDTDCIKGKETAQIVYSDLSSLNSDLEKIYKDNAHASGSADDYVYWIKEAIKDYLEIPLDASKIKLKKSQEIVDLIYKIYQCVTKGNLDEFKLSTISDIEKLFDNIYDLRLGKQKLISILCPVDVEITDSEGNILGCIKNNKVVVTSDDVQMSVDGDKKYCRILLCDDYTINLTGTDDGKMDFIVEEILGDKVIRTISFEELALSEHTQYSGTVDDVILQSGESYSLTSNGGQMISPNNDTYDFSLDEFSAISSFITIPSTVIVTCNGVTLSDGDTIHSGDEICITANVPDGKQISLLTVNEIPYENGDYYTVGYEDVIVDVSYTSQHDNDTQDIDKENKTINYILVLSIAAVFVLFLIVFVLIRCYIKRRNQNNKL